MPHHLRGCGRKASVDREVRPGSRLGAAACFAALLLLYGPARTGADSEELVLPESDRIPVLVALESYRASQGGSEKAEAAWLHRLVSRLERNEGAFDPVRVVDRFVLERDLVAYASVEEDEERLRDLAREEAAHFVILGSLTRLADRYSLDLRLFRADQREPLAHKVFEGEGVEGLAAAVDRAAASARHWIAEPPVEPPHPTVAFDPMARPEEGAEERVVEATVEEERIVEPTIVAPPEPFAEEDPETVDPPTAREPEETVEEAEPTTASGFEVTPPTPTPDVAAPSTPPTDTQSPTDAQGGHEVGRRAGSPAPPGDTPPGLGSAASPRDTPPGPTVVEIRVVGNRRIEADAIRGRVSTRVGEPFSAARARQDLRRIYELGFFRDVQVVSTDRPDGKIVTFIVDENPIIRQVAVAGNTEVGGEEIREQLTLTVGSTIDYPLLLENQRRIEALYQSRGFYLAEATAKVEPLSDDAVTVNFEIIEGRKLRLVEVDFIGNEQFSDKQLTKTMDTRPWRWYSVATQYFDRSGLYAEPIFYQDLDRIRRSYMDSGFIRVRIGEPDVSHDQEGIRVAVTIEEGEQFSVGEIDVIGDATVHASELKELVGMRSGEIFSRTTLTDDVERLQNHYAGRGFFMARVEPQTRVDAATRAVDCTFLVEKGDLYFVEHIEVRGNTRTRDSVVRREMEVAEGALFSATAMERSRARVQRLGFFEEVSVEARPDPTEPNKVNVDVDVVERPTGSFSFGAGFGSGDGFILNSAIKQDNLFGKGYVLNANADFGSQNQNYYLRFTDPYVFGSIASLSSTVFQSKSEFVDFDQKVLGFDMTFGYPLDEGETRAFGGYSYTGRELTSTDVAAASLVQREEFADSSTSLLSFSARRDTRDDVRFPKEGHVTGGALEFAGLGGLSQFLRMEARTTHFIPAKKWLGFDSTFIVNSRAGWTVPFNNISDFDLPGCGTVSGCSGFVGLDPSEIQPLTNIDTDLELPITERYFLGGVGAFQVRGFRARSLGPRRTMLDPQIFSGGDRAFFPTGYAAGGSCQDGNPKSCNSLHDTDIDDFDNLDLTDVIGGNKFFLLNLELRAPISEDLGLEGLVFLDMGNAFGEDEAMNPADLRFGTGAGVQWFSPFGPILVQLGIPLDKLDDEDASVFEFSLGGSQY
jgi:outer membrane protein insertion porin family